MFGLLSGLINKSFTLTHADNLAIVFTSFKPIGALISSPVSRLTSTLLQLLTQTAIWPMRRWKGNHYEDYPYRNAGQLWAMPGPSWT